MHWKGHLSLISNPIGLKLIQRQMSEWDGSRKQISQKSTGNLLRSRNMSNDFQKAADELQALIMEDARKIYSEKVIERWLNPRNLGKLRNPDGFAKIKGPCGDTMQISFKVKDGRLSKIKFKTDGCASSIASGSMATELAQGKKPEEALKISRQMILDALDGLPDESVHCALLASNTLKEAIKNYFDSKRNDPGEQRNKGD